MTERLQMKRCDLCGYRLTLETEIWRRMESANGKHYNVRHKGCGGGFVGLVSKIGG